MTNIDRDGWPVATDREASQPKAHALAADSFGPQGGERVFGAVMG